MKNNENLLISLLAYSKKKCDKLIQRYASATKICADSEDYKNYTFILFDDSADEYYNEWEEILESLIKRKEDIIESGNAPTLWVFGTSPCYVELNSFEDIVLEETEDCGYPDELIDNIIKDNQDLIKKVDNAITEFEDSLKFKKLFAYRPDYSLIILPPNDYINTLKEHNLIEQRFIYE